MYRRAFTVLTIAIMAGLSMGQQNCQQPQLPKPPFNATGMYTGSWQGASSDATQNVTNCLLTFNLQHDPTANWPKDHQVTGTVTVNYDCLELPEWLDTPPPTTVNVTGLITDDGKINLATAGCGTGLCLVLGLGGPGADTNNDTSMDTYSGNWSYQILLAGVQPFGFTGTFAVNRAN